VVPERLVCAGASERHPFPAEVREHPEGPSQRIAGVVRPSHLSRPLEEVNNKIKTLKRQAYGFRDQDYFRLKLYALHKTKHALVG
jgi:hypothetical protein